MKKKIFKFIKKQWLLVWTLIVSTALLAVVAFAEYPGTNNYMKRVVVYDESSEMMFSSNLLSLIDNNRIQYQPYYVRQLTGSDTASTYDVDVYVWNYDIDGSGDYYKKNIDYGLEIKVVDNHGDTITALGSNKLIQIVKNDTDVIKYFDSSSSSFEYTSSENETISTDARSQNKYTIKFSKNWDLTNDTNIRVQIKATPTSEFSDLKPLAAAIGLKEERTEQSSGWEYYINEKTLSSTAAPDKYDAYNLVLTGSGSETITIEWDTTKIAVNKDFYETNGAFPFVSGEVTYTSGGSGGWDRIVISANSYDSAKDYRNRYDIQLYKVDGELGSTWDFIGKTRAVGTYITVTKASD